MSIRLRLMLQCGLLCSLILSLATLFSYAFHARGHYDDLDRVLVAAVGHAAAETLDSVSASRPLNRVADSGGMEIVLRLYNASGMLKGSSSGDESLPLTDPGSVLDAPAGSAFDTLAGLAPPLSAPVKVSDGAFGLFTTNQRWRAYILPLRQGGTTAGFIEGLTPLGRLDASMQALRVLLLTLWFVGTATMFLGLWVVAAKVLRPVAQMTQAAESISSSRDFSRRVEAPPHRDELGHLARTFNEMLSSLEDTYRLQQRFVSDASHELRAPLTVIQGNLELLRRQQNMSETERAEALSETEREAVRLAGLVAELLTLARADAGISIKHLVVDLDAVVLDAFHAARRLSHGQKLDLAPFEPVRVEGDEDRLKQLILILLDNALKYTPTDGRVSLGLRCQNGGAEIVVQDSGPGISAEDLPHVFERFYRADPARSRDPGGSGLGLPIARWIVDQHSGTIALDSRPGQGTVATVRLPLPH